MIRAMTLHRSAAMAARTPSIQLVQRRFAQASANAKPAVAPAVAAETTNAGTNAEAAAAGANADGTGGGEPKYKPGWFSRNPGVTLGGIILGIGLYVYRGTKNKKNFDAVQTPIAEDAVISPYEAWELRSSNEITPEMFDEIRKGVAKAFPQGKAPLFQFDQYLGLRLMESHPRGIGKAYHLERVLASLERDADNKLDVDALLVAFSMAVKGPVDDRLKCLFEMAAQPSASADEESQISQPQFERLIDLLLKTYQIPSEKRVLPIEEEKYPFQQYKSADAHDLLEAAVQAQVDAKQLTAEEANSRELYTFEAFSQIMRGKTVCLWGECFANSKKRMKN